MRTLIVIVISLLFVTCPSHAENKIRITGTFSDLYYHEEAGDLLGFEIRIVLTRNGYEGTFQAAQGGPESLILLKNISVKGNTLEFKIPADFSWAGEFIGKISKNRLTGTLTLNNGNKIALVLKRGKSYWD